MTNHVGYATIKVAQSNSVVIGNHNLCRNVGGKMVRCLKISISYILSLTRSHTRSDIPHTPPTHTPPTQPVPWCYIDDEGNSGFCFKHPGCDQCTGQVEDKDRYCSELYPW